MNLIWIIKILCVYLNYKNLKPMKKPMRIYHLSILGYYANSDTTHQESIECDYMTWDNAGLYAFYASNGSNASKLVACYPIKYTIITYIEEIK